MDRVLGIGVSKTRLDVHDVAAAAVCARGALPIGRDERSGLMRSRQRGIHPPLSRRPL
jgi:hypothetical protein